MKVFKRSLLVITLIIFGGLFINKETVLAAPIPLEKLSYECVYNDGSLFNISWGMPYDDGNGNMIQDISINRELHNIQGSNGQLSYTSGGIFYINPDNSITSTSRHCSQFALLGQVKEDIKDNNEVPETYVKFTANKNDVFQDTEISKGDHWAWFIWKDGADQANKSKVVAELVSEKISIHDVEPNETLYFKRVTNNINDPDSYLIISQYDDFTVLSTGARITIIDNDFNKLKGLAMGGKIYVNDPEPKVVNSSAGSNSYYYSEKRYDVSLTKTSRHRFEYERVEASEDIDIYLGSALCDELLKNSKIPLKRIIGILQLLVPALMIILCALDLAKMVFAGKLEDEIPKARKRLITRLVVGAAFFFVPLVVSLTIYMLKDSGAQNTELIEKIDCLFN